MGKLRQVIHEEQIPLSLAAAIVFDQLVGGRLKNAGDLRELLNRTGLAILNTVPVSVFDLKKRVTRVLTNSEIGQVTVSRGAMELTVSNGTSFLTPTVTRRDMDNAVTLLKGSGANAGLDQFEHG